MPESSMRHEPSFLKDILSACRKIESIVAATSEDAFLTDRSPEVQWRLIWIGRSFGTHSNLQH